MTRPPTTSRCFFFFSLLISCGTEALAQMFPEGRRWQLFPVRSLCWWCSDGLLSIHTQRQIRYICPNSLGGFIKQSCLIWWSRKMVSGFVSQSMTILFMGVLLLWMKKRLTSLQTNLWCFYALCCWKLCTDCLIFAFGCTAFHTGLHQPQTLQCIVEYQLQLWLFCHEHRFNAG